MQKRQGLYCSGVKVEILDLVEIWTGKSAGSFMINAWLASFGLPMESTLGTTPLIQYQSGDRFSGLDQSQKENLKYMLNVITLAINMECGRSNFGWNLSTE